MCTIAKMRVQSCIRPANGFFANAALMSSARQRSIEMLDALCEHTGKKLSHVATAAGLSPSTLTRYYNDETVKHELSIPTLEKLRKAYPSFFKPLPETITPTGAMEYLSVEVMPTFGGMGGGGNGEGDTETALLPRYLVEDQLRAKPADLLLIEVRGDSMSPDFLHGDQILVDRRDCNPRQPGPFALFDGDGIVIKLVERVPTRRGFYRVFSANNRYSEYEVDEQEVRIIGRPVWFARQI